MCGWLMPAVARASRHNRLRAVSSRLAADRLERDRAVEAFVAGRVDDAHAAFADGPLDPVAADALG